MKIRVKFLAKDVYDDVIKAQDLSVLKHGDWIDLRAGEKMHIGQGQYRLIPLGIAMELPKGFEGIVSPRSSTYKNFGIIAANSIGIIDHAYCGDSDEWKFPAIATRDTDILPGDRICQFRILYNQPRCDTEIVETLGNDNRGGVGSTGTR